MLKYWILTDKFVVLFWLLYIVIDKNIIHPFNIQNSHHDGIVFNYIDMRSMNSRGLLLLLL